MRLFSFVTAIVVAAVLVLLVLQRDKVLEFAGRGAPEASPAAEQSAANEEPQAPDSRVSVVVRKSVARPVDNAVLVRGRTEAARQVEVRAETSGVIISDPLRRGAMVEAGQVLCQIDPGTRDAALAEAEARLADALINDRVASQLKQDGFASETRVASTSALVSSARASVAAAKREIERLTVTAPFEGLLESDSAELGSLLQTGAVCATVIQLDPIKIVGFLAETDVDRVSTDSLVGARLASGREIAGQVTFVSRAADSTTRTFRVEAEISNPDLSIRDGQTADMVISAGGAEAHLLPQSALTLNDDGTIGVRLVIDGTVQFAPIDVIRDTPKGVWVDGLPDSAEVIVVGQEFVTDGVKVRSVYEEYGQ